MTEQQFNEVANDVRNALKVGINGQNAPQIGDGRCPSPSLRSPSPSPSNQGSSTGSSSNNGASFVANQNMHVQPMGRGFLSVQERRERGEAAKRAAKLNRSFGRHSLGGTVSGKLTPEERRRKGDKRRKMDKAASLPPMSRPKMVKDVTDELRQYDDTTQASPDFF